MSFPVCVIACLHRQSVIRVLINDGNSGLVLAPQTKGTKASIATVTGIFALTLSQCKFSLRETVLRHLFHYKTNPYFKLNAVPALSRN
jgi:hypothetical protein